MEEKILILQLSKRVCEGAEISFAEAMQLASIEDQESFDALLEAADGITRCFHSRQPDLCSLINAKSYLCPEDCAFCSQSIHYQTTAKRYSLMARDEVVRRAKEIEKTGIKNLCIVTSGGSLTKNEFAEVLAVVRRLCRETSLRVDGSLGFLTEPQVRELKAAGLRRFNNNLQCSRNFYGNIVSTHTYEQRLETMRNLQEGGLEICSGGILNMGESREDRIRLAFELKPFSPKCLPVNILDARPGTPLEKQSKMEPKEILKTIAVFRFIHPRSNIKLAGGREKNLSVQEQRMALCGGANGLVVCGYLTTSGNPLENDLNLLRDAGFEPDLGGASCSCKTDDLALEQSKYKDIAS